MVSTTSSPLNTKIRQGCEAGGFRASGGSWYLREILVPSTRLAALASAPVGLKLGFSLSGGAPPYFEGGWAESSSPRKEISCDGSAFLARLCGEDEREGDGERVRRRRLGGGDVDAEGERVRGLRERYGIGERERRPSLDLSFRRRSLERERSRRLCLSLERSRFLCLSPPLSLSCERSRRLSFERSFFLSPDLSCLLSRDLSRRLSLERSFLRSLEPSRLLSLDESRGFLYGSGDCSRLRTALGSVAASFGSSSLDRCLGFLSLDLLRDGRPDAIEGSFPTRSDPCFEKLLGLPFPPETAGGEAVFPWTNCCVSSRRALYGDKSLAILGPDGENRGGAVSWLGAQ